MTIKSLNIARIGIQIIILIKIFSRYLNEIKAWFRLSTLYSSLDVLTSGWLHIIARFPQMKPNRLFSEGQFFFSMIKSRKVKWVNDI